MPQLALPHPSVEIAGAIDLAPDPSGGVRPRRLPPVAAEQSSDAALDLMAAMTCGVRLRFATSASRFALTMRTLRLEMRSETPPWPLPVVSVLVDGVHVRDLPAPEGDVIVIDDRSALLDVRGGEDGVLVVDDLPGGLKEVEVWLPQSAACTLRSLDVDDVRPPAPDERPRWWHHGSSISHGFEATSPLTTWPSVAAADAGLSLTNLGLAGQAMLDPFVARAIADSDADVVSLCLGINIHNGAAMTMRTFEPAVHHFLDVVRDGLPGVPIHVISPVPFPSGEGVPGPDVVQGPVVVATGDPATAPSGSLTIAIIRDTIERIVRTRSAQEPDLFYVDGRELLRPDEAHHLADGLHPDAAGHTLMGHRFGAILRAAHHGSRVPR